MTETNANLPAPYMGYGVFLKSIETLSDTVVPSGPLDRRVLKDFSGGDYSALVSGLRFLGLTDDHRKATAKYRELVGLWNDKPKFKETLFEILTASYLPIVKGLDLKHGTSAELEKAFKDYGVPQGQMLEKAVRFFVKAFSDNGMTLSPHMTAPKPRAQGPRRKPAPQPQGTLPDHNHSRPVDELPPGYERLPLPGMG
ncbi:MAG: hypothetical protein KGL75_10040, partial [Acidobacteriota bacterium]|nr:hypothetical protein [Acidobacteriota bacterium]